MGFFFFKKNYQIIIDGRDSTAVDNDGCRLPTLVYMAREKRPGRPHNYKAGAMNALVHQHFVPIISQIPTI